MSTLTTLLEVQRRDTEADQLRHRRAALAERAALASVEARLVELERAAGAVEAQRAEVARAQRRVEDEIASLEAKRATAERRMAGNANVREVQSLQGEIESLERRRSDLETDVLEAMEAADPLDGELARLGRDRAELDGRAVDLRAALAEAEVAIDAELAQVVTARAELAAGLPEPVLRRYDQLRSKLGGVAVAPLEGTRCGGCHLVIPAVELDALRHLPPDEVATCEQCGRILVRT